MFESALKDAMVNRIMHWSNINSGTFNISGLQGMSHELTQCFSQLDCASEIIATPAYEQMDDQGNIQIIHLSPLLHFWTRPEAPVKVLLVGHMDTVFEAEHPFQHAYKKVDDQKLIGPGVADMKGGLCIMLEALRKFELTADKHKLGWEVIINGDEEIGSVGSAPYIEERAKHNHFGLIFEPAMDDAGTLAGERKGSGKFTILVHGKTAHAGRDFHKGRNAIVLLSKLITEMNNLNHQREGLTLNVGQIKGGGAVNVVPAIAFCRIDIRMSEPEDALWIQDKLSQLIANANQDGFSVEINGKFGRVPKKINDKTKVLYDLVLKTSAELGRPLSIQSSGGCSDGNNLSKVGLPNVDTLGVRGGNIHSQDEYLLMDSLVERVELTTALLRRLTK